MSLLDVPPSYTDSLRPRSKSLNSHSSGHSHPHHHPRRHPKQRKHVADVIDRLDDTSFGGAYHHQGPYDAAARSYNLNPKYSPVAATKEGNRAAWDATPREAQLDSLLRGRPLDSVSAVAPGHRNPLSGEVMNYEEGPDLMREMNPGGGAYKRWPGIQYHPDDLKGKGEPGFTIDNERKARKAAEGVSRSKSARHHERRGEYEMVSQEDRRYPPRPQYGRMSSGAKGEPPVFVRQRSMSASGMASSSSASRPGPSTFKEGLKRRFGSLRKK